MKRLHLLIWLGVLVIAPAYGDFLPIAGSTSGGFSNATGGSSASGAIWTYSGSNGFVTFTPASFSGTTGQQFTLGQLTLTNTANGGNGTFGAQLGLSVNFTNPAGQSAVFSDTLQLIAMSGPGGADTLNLNFGGFPAPQQFTSGGATYTVNYDGFFNSLGVAITQLSVPNQPGGSLSAQLKGTISAASTTQTAVTTVPEPSSIALLGTMIGAAALGLRRVAR